MSGVRPDTIVGLAGYAEYEIDIEIILRADLPSKFQSMLSAPLEAGTVDQLPAGAKGAYLLLRDEIPVYAGKTDTRHGFRDRLLRHVASVQHRVGLDPGRMRFKAIRVLVFSNFDVEAILINEMRRRDGTALRWNDSGFGSNDPGRNRDGQEPSRFDSEFPVDVDRPITTPAGVGSALAALNRLKQSVPYLLRFESHPDLDAATVSLSAIDTMRTGLRAVLDALTPNWQATILHGRAILYRETREYRHARDMMRSPG